jgi:TATA-binding protein-associated factor Taf7
VNRRTVESIEKEVARLLREDAKALEVCDVDYLIILLD